MRNKLTSIINTLSTGSTKAYIKRVGWIGLEERIRQEIDIFKKKHPEITELGNIYVKSAIEEYPYFKEKLTRVNIINSIHIFTGHRLLGVCGKKGENRETYSLKERNAQLWYSQSPSGDVAVFVAPYQSDGHSTIEKEILLYRYSDPAKISNSEIKNHVNVFIKYCVATSTHGGLGLRQYIYRLYLMSKDFRNRSEIRSKVFSILNWLTFVGLSILAIFATLYAGNKL